MKASQLTFLFTFLLLSFNLYAQTFNYGTGSIASNPAGFNAVGSFTGYSITGNDLTVTGNINLPTGTYNFANVTINTGVTVTVTGNTAPLIIRCTGNFINNGDLRAVSGNGGNASGVTGGAAGVAVAGGVNGGVGGAGGSGASGTTGPGLNFGTSTGRGLQGCGVSNTRPAWAGPGGGGGAYGSAGTNGGNGTGGTSGCTTGGLTGSVYGNASLTLQVGASATYFSAGQTTAGDRWILGGSSGAGGHGTQSILSSARAAGGGGGASGGAIQIVANSVTIGSGAWIRCRGGNGGNGSVSSGSNAGGGGGGGGAGGTINIQYMSSYTNNGTIQVAGGIGGSQGFGTTGTGGAGGNGGSGRQLVEQDVILCTAPTTQASSFSFSNVTTSSVDISFNRGNGNGGVLVVARATTAPTGPTSGTSYTANSIFGSGSTTAAGSYVLYNSNAAGPVTFNVTGLTGGTSYQFGIYEYNTTGTCYLNPGLSGTINIPVCLPPSTQASGALVTPAVNSATLNWTPGSGTGGQLVVLRQGAAVSGDPVQTTTYTASTTFGSGSGLGGGFVVHATTGGSVNVSNLIENTTYHYAIYSFNTSGPCYTLPALTGSFTTSNGPMSYISSTNVQQTGNSPLGSTNQPILRFEVVGGPGTSPALTVSGITFNTTGTTNPANLTGARIYFTGSSTTFATTTLFGTQVDNPSGSHVVSGSQVLAPGVNYFWLVYDVSIAGTPGNVMDAQITSVNIGSAQTPTETNPAGTRTITSLMSLSCGYTFTHFTPTWTSNVTDPSRTIVASGAASIDDQRWPGQNFASGFTFEFNGTIYSSFGISSKGFIWFGATNPSGLSFTPISSTLAYEGAIAPFAFDMVAHSASTTTPQVTIRYTGTAPNRVCIIEWTAFRPWNNTGGLCPGFGSPTDWNRYDFQLHLYENGGTNGNRIEFVYRDMNSFCVNANGASAQVGLRGASNTDFINRQGSGNNAHTASSVGTLNTQVIAHGANNYFNGNGGMRYSPSFQKPIVSPSPTASNVCPDLTVNLSTTSPVASKQWYRDNLPITGATSPIYSADASGSHILVVTQGGCSKVSEVTNVTINPCLISWSGTNGTDWNDPLNWSPSGVPPVDANILIPNTANKPVISGLSPIISNLTIDPGARLTVSSNGSLTVKGVLTNNSSAPNGVIVSSGGALVQTSSSTLAGTGNYTVNRTIPAAGPNNTFRFMGSPISNISVGSFGIAGTGPNGGQVLPLAGCSPTAVQFASPFGNILELRENATPVFNCAQSLWHVKSAGTLENGRGYSMKVNPNATYSFSGTVNNGVVTVTGLTSNSGDINDHFTGPSQQRGWHLLANPYPSPIQITASDRTSQGFLGQIQIWNPASGSFVPSVGTVTIPVGQGFQIKNISGSTQSFTFTNDMRVATVGATFYDNEDWCNYFTTIRVNGNGYTDETVVFFHNLATDEFDNALDANKLPGNYFQPTLFTMAGTQRMSYNGLPNPMASKVVPLNFAAGTNGTFTLEFNNLNTFPLSSMIFLQDLKTGVEINIREQNTYTFNGLASDNIDRFRIRFEPSVSVNVQHNACNNSADGKITLQNPSSINWTAELYANNQLVSQKTVAAGEGQVLGSLTAGNYLLNLVLGSYTTSQIIQLESASNLTPVIQVSKSEVSTNEMFTAQVSEPNANSSYTWMLNDMYVGSGEQLNVAINEAGNYTLSLMEQVANCTAITNQAITVSVAQTTGVSNVKVNDISIYPNPVHDQLQLSLMNAQDYQTLKIVDLSGRMVYNEQINSRASDLVLQINVEKLASGIYQLVLDGKENRKTMLFSIVR